MAKEEIAAEVMEHFARGFHALMQLAEHTQATTVVIQPKALSADDAAAYVGMSRTRFYATKERFPTTLIDGQKRYLTKHLDAYLRQCEKES